MKTASIIIVNRNYANFVGQAIDSALEQSYASEVVVVDDGSEDGSRDVIRSYGTRLVPVFRSWQGQASAINAGVAAASGSVLFLLDSDDLCDSNRVASIMPLFEQQGKLLWARHSLRAVDEANRIIVKDLYQFGGIHDEIGLQILVEGKTPGTTSGLVFRRSFFEKLGPIPEHYTTYPDSYLLIRGALTGCGTSVQRPLGSHRWHRGSFTAYHWRQFERARFHLALRKFLAEDASVVARQVQGPLSIVEGRTWWQIKAKAEWKKSGFGGNGDRGALFRRFLAATMSSELPPTRRAALALRGLILWMMPQGVFDKTWWITHVGRPSIIRMDVRRRHT